MFLTTNCDRIYAGKGSVNYVRNENQNETWMLPFQQSLGNRLRNDPGFYKKEYLHDYLQKNPGTIKVAIWPYPNVIPAISNRNEKYVRSSPNDYTHDNLLDVPRE